MSLLLLYVLLNGGRVGTWHNAPSPRDGFQNLTKWKLSLKFDTERIWTHWVLFGRTNNQGGLYFRTYPAYCFEKMKLRVQEGWMRQTAFSGKRALYPVTRPKKTRQRRMTNSSITFWNQSCQYSAVGERFFPKKLSTIKNRPCNAFYQLSIWAIIHHRWFLLSLHREIFWHLMPAHSNYWARVSWMHWSDKR